MSHFLFVTVFAGGNVPPQLGLAKRLVARGHRVTVLADDCLAGEVKAAGARFVGYRRASNQPTKRVDDYRVTDWAFKNPLTGFRQMIVKVSCEPALDVALDMIDLHREDPFEVVAGCGMIFGPILGAEKLGLPYLVLMSNLDLRAVPGKPPGGPGFQPLRGPIGWLRDRAVTSVFRHVVAAGAPYLRKARQALDLPPVDHPLEEYSRAHRVLLLTSQAFDFPHQLPPKTLFTGPIIDDPSWADAGDLVLRELETVDKKIVLVTLGSTFQDQKEVYRRITLALGRLDIHAVMTLGEVFDAADFAAPPNVRIVRAAPHQPILARASAALIHCGHGSVIKGLAAGVPLLCMPLGRDQLDNAARVTWHGAGLSIKANATPERIAAALAKVLATPAMKTSAQRLGAAIQQEISRNLAVSELEAAAAQGTH